MYLPGTEYAHWLGRIVQDSSHLLYHLKIPRADTKGIEHGERRLDSALSRGVMGNGFFSEDENDNYFAIGPVPLKTQ